MASSNRAYATTLRGEAPEQPRDVSGVPCFVSHLARVKTNVMCPRHLLLPHETDDDSGSAAFSATTATTKSNSNGNSSGNNGPSSASLLSTSYRTQGNQELYTDENLAQRQRLLTDPRVLTELARFWDTFPSIRAGTAAVLTKREYVDLFLKLYKALVHPSEFAIGEARVIVARDWRRDCGDAGGDQGVMSKPRFFRALFEVADLWTTDIGAESYATFLFKLFERVTVTQFDAERSAWHIVFAALDQVHSMASELSESEGQTTAELSSITNPPKQSAQAVPIPASAGIARANQDQNRNPSQNQYQNQNADPSQKSSQLRTEDTVFDVATSDRTGPSMGSALKPRAPLLRKKMMSLPTGLGDDSPSKSRAQLNIGINRSGSGSMRRLPELAPTSPLGIGNRSPVSPTPVAAGSVGDLKPHDESSRKISWDPAASPRRMHTPTAPEQDESGGRPGAEDVLISSLSPSRRRGTAANPLGMAPLSPQQPQSLQQQPVRLAMPSIYLSPEITPAHSPTRRRVRESSSQFAQRLRRTTF